MKKKCKGRFFAFGVKRSPNWFFFEVDERKNLSKLLEEVKSCFFFPKNYQIRVTERGYHIIAYEKGSEILFDWLWKRFKMRFKSDFYKGSKKNPQILRISPKMDENGRIISPAPLILIQKGKLPAFSVDNLVLYRGFLY